MYVWVKLPTWLVIVRLAMETTFLVIAGIRICHTHCGKVAMRDPRPKYPENVSWGCSLDPGQRDISRGSGNTQVNSVTEPPA